MSRTADNNYMKNALPSLRKFTLKEKFCAQQNSVNMRKVHSRALHSNKTIL